MSKADEMFEKLGYIKDIGSDYGLIRYNKDNHYLIRFMMDMEEVECNAISLDNRIWILPIDMELLQAINEKVKELGWNE